MRKPGSSFRLTFGSHLFLNVDAGSAGNAHSFSVRPRILNVKLNRGEVVTLVSGVTCYPNVLIKVAANGTLVNRIGGNGVLLKLSGLLGTLPFDLLEVGTHEVINADVRRGCAAF